MWTTKDAVSQVPGADERAEVRRLRAKLRRLGEAYKRLRARGVTMSMLFHCPECGDSADELATRADEIAWLKSQNARLYRHAEALYKVMVAAAKDYDIGDDDYHEAMANYRLDFPVKDKP